MADEVCSSCAIAGICHKAVAEDITVSAKNRWIAIVVAFVVPLLLLIGGVLSGRFSPVSEEISALIALTAVVLYYGALAGYYRLKDRKKDSKDI